MDAYLVQRCIGSGTFGQAYLVTCVASNRQYVIKEVKVAALNKKARDDALNEVKVLQQLSHPYIVRYHDAFVEGLKLHIAMEYCANGDLHDRIQRQRAHGSLFPQGQVLDWMAQLLLALDFMHSKKILHRDLKSKNIFISARNHLKLGDFGVARCLQSTNQLAYSLVGTPYYLSPEIASGRPYHTKSDCWAAGCVFYELLTLEHAFQARDISALLVKITAGRYAEPPMTFDRAVREVVRALLQTRPERRWSCFEVLVSRVFRPHVTKYARGARTELLDALRPTASSQVGAAKHGMSPKQSQHSGDAAENASAMPARPEEGLKRAKTEAAPRTRQLPMPPSAEHPHRRNHTPEKTASQHPARAAAASTHPAPAAVPMEDCPALAGTPEMKAVPPKAPSPPASLDAALLRDAPQSPAPVLPALPRVRGRGCCYNREQQSTDPDTTATAGPPPVLITHCQGRNLPRPRARRSLYDCKASPAPAPAMECALTQHAHGPTQSPPTHRAVNTSAADEEPPEVHVGSVAKLGSIAGDRSIHCWVLVSPLQIDDDEAFVLVDERPDPAEDAKPPSGLADASLSPSQVLVSCNTDGSDGFLPMEAVEQGLLQPEAAAVATAGARVDDSNKQPPYLAPSAGSVNEDAPAANTPAVLPLEVAGAAEVKFMFGGATLRLDVTTCATPSSRLEALRSFLEARLGDDLCIQVYRHVQATVCDGDMQARLASIRLTLGSEHSAYLPLVMQLVRAELEWQRTV